jgi:hypothetical protein
MTSNLITPKNTTDDAYIISFAQGSSGRFVKFLLYNLLTDSSVELNVHPITNSTHWGNRRYTGYTHDRVIHEDGGAKDWSDGRHDVWHTFEFDNPLQESNAPKIFHTHRFPDFKLIHNRLGPNVKFIIITVDPFDLIEVVINNKLKNYYDVITGVSTDTAGHPAIMRTLIKHYQKFLGKHYPLQFVKEDIVQIAKGIAMENLAYFLSKATTTGNFRDRDLENRVGTYMSYMNNSPSIEYPEDHILFLPYHELHAYKNDAYVWLKKLEDFTGKTANSATKASYQKYIDGRNKLLKEYRI